MNLGAAKEQVARSGKDFAFFWVVTLFKDETFTEFDRRQALNLAYSHQPFVSGVSRLLVGQSCIELTF